MLLTVTLFFSGEEDSEAVMLRDMFLRDFTAEVILLDHVTGRRLASNSPPPRRDYQPPQPKYSTSKNSTSKMNAGQLLDIFFFTEACAQKQKISV